MSESSLVSHYLYLFFVNLIMEKGTSNRYLHLNISSTLNGLAMSGLEDYRQLNLTSDLTTADLFIFLFIFWIRIEEEIGSQEVQNEWRYIFGTFIWKNTSIFHKLHLGWLAAVSNQVYCAARQGLMITGLTAWSRFRIIRMPIWAVKFTNLSTSVAKKSTFYNSASFELEERRLCSK